VKSVAKMMLNKFEFDL